MRDSLHGARVALLTNFVAPYRVPLFRYLAGRLGALKIFVSTEMEPNRSWPVDWGDLDVEVLNTWSVRETSQHPHAFDDPSFVHFPYDALIRLRRERPDVVVSGQLGASSLLAAVHCLFRKRTKLVLWLTLSEISELGRGGFRRQLRRRLLARADALLVNGDSGARYARSLGTPEQKIFRVYQAVEPSAFEGPHHRGTGSTLRLLFVGSPEPRKGLGPFLERLAARAAAHPEREIELRVAGTHASELESSLPKLPTNLDVHWLGNVSYDQMPALYADADVLAFPTLADEWGLVANEALSAGLPVLGSVYSQAVVELIEDGRTGWTFRPDDDDECQAALERVIAASPETLRAMGNACRERITDFGIEAVGERMLAAIAFARRDHSSDAI
jgi:glycosyltransferase involved in cell wall biosynthesis